MVFNEEEFKKFYENYKKSQDKYWQEETEKYKEQEKLKEQMKKDDFFLKYAIIKYKEEYGVYPTDKIGNIKLRL